MSLLSSAKAPVGRLALIGGLQLATSSSSIATNGDRSRINTKMRSRRIDSLSHPGSDRIDQVAKKSSSLIGVSSGKVQSTRVGRSLDQIKKKTLTINTHSFSTQGESDNVKIGANRDRTGTNHITPLIDQSRAEKLAKFEEFVKETEEIAHGVVVCNFDFSEHNINKLSTLRNFYEKKINLFLFNPTRYQFYHLLYL